MCVVHNPFLIDDEPFVILKIIPRIRSTSQIDYSRISGMVFKKPDLMVASPSS